MTRATAKALELLTHEGKRLFPLVPYGKKPRIEDWPERATTDMDQVYRWLEQFPRCNWGLATGSLSKVFVIDQDGARGLESARAWSRTHGPDWKATLISRTARGYHLYYRWPVGLEVRNSASDLAPGIDVRGEGGYAVVPPSFVRPPAAVKDHRYSWVDQGIAIASPPEWLLEVLEKLEQSRGKHDSNFPSSASAGFAIPEGRRNQTLASVAGSMRSRGMCYDAILVALKAENANRCTPPLDEFEVERIAASIARYEPGHHAVAISGDWPEPQELGAELLPVERLSLDLLPSSFRPLVEDISERMQTPADFSAAAAVVSLAGCANRRAVIRPKKLDTWEVVPNLWGMIIAPPGFLKSPILREVTRPLEKIEELWREAHKEASANYEIEAEKAKLRKQAWCESYKIAIKRGHPVPVVPDDSLVRLAQRRLLIGDATFEKLHELLAENPEGLLSVRDELIGWLGELEKPGRESERGFYLQAWNGDAGFSVDRIGRGTVHVPHVCLSLIGNIQPARFRSYIRDALTGGPGDDGLLQRFQILVWPDLCPDWKNIDREPNHLAVLLLERIFTRLANLSADVPIQLRFSADAQQLFDDWRTELEAKVRGARNLHAALVAHLSKYRSLLPSLAGLFELADLAAAGADLGSEATINLDHARQAAAFCDYLEAHARRAYACMLSPELAAARELARHFSAGDLPETFRTRDVYRRGWSGLTQPEEVRKALELLADSGWIQQQETPPPVTGGRPTELWQLNPKVRRHEQ